MDRQDKLLTNYFCRSHTSLKTAVKIATITFLLLKNTYGLESKVVFCFSVLFLNLKLISKTDFSTSLTCLLQELRKIKVTMVDWCFALLGNHYLRHLMTVTWNVSLGENARQTVAKRRVIHEYKKNRRFVSNSLWLCLTHHDHLWRQGKNTLQTNSR